MLNRKKIQFDFFLLQDILMQLFEAEKLKDRGLNATFCFSAAYAVMGEFIEKLNDS